MMDAGRSEPLLSEATAPIARRIDALDWNAIADMLDGRGWATAPALLTPQECRQTIALYGDDKRFRSRVVMARHGFGAGEYRYFSRPLPPLVADLRRLLYPKLAPVANAWAARQGRSSFPLTHDAFLAECHKAGQTRPTPLLLRYGPGDYNRLHQDLYGDIHFPLQVAVLLDEPGVGFEGGAFVLTEQTPRRQSRAHVVPLGLGDAVIFAVNDRPVRGARGFHTVRMRHGVSEVWSGRRHTLGIIFHDAP